MPKARLKSGLTLHYQHVGQGPDLVMIHGLTGNLASWHLAIVPLLRTHFRILTYDLRGHGYSDAPPTGYTTADMASDLKELLDILGIERPYLVGHSYGADTALYFALLHPQRVEKIIAAEPGLPAYIQSRQGKDWEGWDHMSRALAHFGFDVPPDKRHDIDYLLRLTLQIPKLHGPVRGRARRPEPLLRLLETSMIQDYGVVGALSLDRVPCIQTPVLLVYGADSVFLGTCEYLHTHLPHAREVLLPPSVWGHLGPLEQPDLFVASALDFLTPALPSGDHDVRLGQPVHRQDG